MININKKDKILIITHQHVIGVSQKLYSFFKKRQIKTAYLGHNLFPNKEIGLSDFNEFNILNEKNKRYGYYFNGIMPSYLIHFYLNIISLFKNKYDYVICFNCLNAFSILILKRLIKKTKIIFYTIDYTDYRFNNNFLNKLYKYFDKYSAENADYVINLSERVSNMRIKKKYDLKSSQYILPVGTDNNKIDNNLDKRFKSKKIVCLSTIYKRQGVQILVKTAAKLKKLKYKVRFDIIGDGPYLNTIKNYCNTLNVNEYFKFHGLVKDKIHLNKLLLSSSIGIAPYKIDKQKTSIAYYADVTKPKDYISFNLPVLITDAVEVASTINRFNAGMIINYNHNDICKKIISIFNNYSLYKQLSNNAGIMSKIFNQEKIFANFFQCNEN